MKRIFIGIDISEGARNAVAEYVSSLRRSFPALRVGWERPEKLHLTLKFLGEVDDRKLDEISDAARIAASLHPSYSAALSGTGCFPPKGDPRILWIGMKDNGETEKLASKVEMQFERLRFEREKRRFSPHLTIARLREPRSSRELAKYHSSREFGPIEVQVSEITVFESILGSAGSIYRRIAAFPLSNVG
jgi:RNA 2',3'-cyclic 3'-phosphodiesterase